MSYRFQGKFVNYLILSNYTLKLKRKVITDSNADCVCARSFFRLIEKTNEISVWWQLFMTQNKKNNSLLPTTTTTATVRMEL